MKGNRLKSLERADLLNELIEPVQQLLIKLYGSTEKFVNASNIHLLEPYILRYEKICGEKTQVLSLSEEMNIQIHTDDPAVEMYNYLNHLVEHPEEIKILGIDE